MAITSLKQTKWLFNETFTSCAVEPDATINFKSNNVDYTRFDLMINPTNQSVFVIQYINDDTSVTAYSTSGWGNQAYRTITIVDGDDVENATLIAFLEANAVQLEYDLVEPEEPVEPETPVEPEAPEDKPLQFQETNTNLAIYENLTAKDYERLEKNEHALYIVKNVGIYKGTKLIADINTNTGLTTYTGTVTISHDFGQLEHGFGTLSPLYNITGTFSEEEYAGLYNTASDSVTKNGLWRYTIRLTVEYEEKEITGLDPNTQQFIYEWHSRNQLIGDFNFKEFRYTEPQSPPTMIWEIACGLEVLQLQIDNEGNWTIVPPDSETYYTNQSENDGELLCLEDVKNILKGHYSRVILNGGSIFNIRYQSDDHLMLEQFAEYSLPGSIDGMQLIRPFMYYCMISYKEYSDTMETKMAYSFPSTVFANPGDESEELLKVLHVNGMTYDMTPKAGDHIYIDSDHAINVNLPSVMKSFTYGNINSMANAKFTKEDFDHLRYHASVLGFTSYQGSTKAMAYLFKPVVSTLDTIDGATVETMELVCDSNPKMRIILTLNGSTNTVTSSWSQEISVDETTIQDMIDSAIANTLQGGY